MRHLRLLVGVFVVCLVCAPVVSAVAVGGDTTPSSSTAPHVGGHDGDGTNVCAGHQTTDANGITVVSVQGARFQPENTKKPARLVAYGPSGEILWVHDSNDDPGVVWSYDVDPLGNGNLFVTATRPG
ncbi:MAG: hypothetical protein ABEI99_07195, partial [Halobaculum sp.]